MDLPTLCDAVAADIKANVNLPPHELWLYTEPTGIGPDWAPLLVVFPTDDLYEVETTDGSYGVTHRLRVGWAVDASFGSESGGLGIPELAKAELARTRAIVARMQTYVAGVPGQPGLTAVLDKVAYRGVADGLLWRFDAQLLVAE